jgi:hypothetical protein
MGIIIKTGRSGLKDIKFSEWVKLVDWSDPHVLTLLAFFVPAKYPSFTLSFTDSEYRIRKSFNRDNEEIKKELKKWYEKIVKGKGKALFEVRKTDSGYIIDFIDLDKDESFEYRKDVNGSLILKKIKDQKEDIPF